MGVQQYEDLSKDVKKLFKLDTKNTSYVIAVVDDEQFLGHVYYGQKLNDYQDRKSTRLNSSHSGESRMPSSA